MRSLLTAILATCLSLATGPGLVHAESPPPPTGMAGLIVGVGLTAVGAFTTVSAFSICANGAGELVTPCVVPIATVGVAALVGGVVGLTLGIKRRVAYKAWQRERTTTGRTLTLVPTFGHDGMGILLAARY
jgi:hypothetical protein